MSFSIYEASAPIFVNALTNMRAWLVKIPGDGAEANFMNARLAADMQPLPAQFQMASDTAKNAMARLCGIESPAMPDTEVTITELQDRCDQTIAFVRSIDRAMLAGAADRTIEMRFPNGGYHFTGATFLANFALPNFFFHVTTAYAILRAAGLPLGKPDFFQHLGAPDT